MPEIPHKINKANQKAYPEISIPPITKANINVIILGIIAQATYFCQVS